MSARFPTKEERRLRYKLNRYYLPRAKFVRRLGDSFVLLDLWKPWTAIEDDLDLQQRAIDLGLIPRPDRK